VGDPEGKKLLGRPRHRWENNIKMNLREIGWDDDMDWISGLGQGPMAASCDESTESSRFIKM
jgi:hypothetical protein